MRVAALLVLFSLTLSIGATAAEGAIVVGPNIDITLNSDLNNSQQVEPTIAIHPLKPNIIVAGAQDLRLRPEGGHRWHGYYRSTDGGQTWTVSLLPGFPGDTSPEGTSSPLRGFHFTTDPVLAFDRSGNVYYAGIAVELTATGGVNFRTLRAFVAKYTKDGADYLRTTIVANVVADKPWIAVDTTGGPKDGNVYLVFDRSNAVFTRSTDGGVTFSRPVTLPGGGILPGITVDPGGTIYISTIANGFRRILVLRSTDGGLTFHRPVRAATIEPIPDPLPENMFRVFTIPQIAADARGVYLVWDDFRSGDADVLLARSTDGGSTWTVPVRVNDVTIEQQFFPSVVASGGVVSVVWYDSRLDDGGRISSLDVFYAQSLDGGLSFSSGIRVTDVSSDPNLVLRSDPPGSFFPFMGDYIQIAASPTEAHPIWTDNRNSCNTIDPTFGCIDQDVFTVTISF